MMRRELTIHRADGTCQTIACERDDGAGRRELDRIAFAALERDDVERVEVSAPMDRAAGYGRSR